jgi:hypothetical protein
MEVYSAPCSEKNRITLRTAHFIWAYRVRTRELRVDSQKLRFCNCICLPYAGFAPEKIAKHCFNKNVNNKCH